MPEGDTIHRAAGRLRPVLAGQTLTRFEAPRLLGDRPRPGVRIDSVEAVGKTCWSTSTAGSPSRPTCG